MSLQRRILIHDDDDTIRRTLARYLSEQGFSTTVACDHNNCLILCKENPPDLLLTYRTWNFQKDLDLLKQLRSDLAIPYFPIIVMGVEKSFEEIFRSAGATACIQIVFDIKDLPKAINRLLADSS